MEIADPVVRETVAKQREIARRKAQEILQDSLSVVMPDRDDQGRVKSLAEDWSRRYTAEQPRRGYFWGPLRGLIDEATDFVPDPESLSSRPVLQMASQVAKTYGPDWAARDKRDIQNFVAALNPRAEANPPVEGDLYAFGRRAGYGNERSLTSDVKNSRRRGYRGAGWTPEDEKRFGTPESQWELSPGDQMEHGRRLNAHTMSALHKELDTYRQNFQGPDAQLNADGLYTLVPGIQRAVLDHDRAKGSHLAATGFQGIYPWRRGWGAFGDATTSHASPIGRFFAQGLFTGDAAANVAMGSRQDRVGSAVDRYYLDKYYGVPSPRGVPNGTPEERDAFVDNMRSASQDLSAPSFSEYYWKNYGAPPSYFAQGAATIGNMLADLSAPAAFGGNKLIHLINRATSGRTIPMILGMSRQSLPMLIDGGDLPVAAALQGLGTAAAPVKPGLVGAFVGGKENRPDLTSPDPFAGRGYGLTDPGIRGEPGKMPVDRHFDQREGRADNARFLANLAEEVHPESNKNKPGWLDYIGSAMGRAAGEAGRYRTPTPAGIPTEMFR